MTGEQKQLLGYLQRCQSAINYRGAVDLLFHVTPSTGQDVAKKYIYLDLHLVLAQQVRM